MDCFQCLSLWVALPVAFFVVQRPIEIVVTWLALSGAACLLERLEREPVVIEPIKTEQEETDLGMLRTETSGFQEHYISDESSDGHSTDA
jgi:hypothetical protein